MSVVGTRYTQTGFGEVRFCMEPTTQKLIRGILYLIAMGFLSTMAIIETQQYHWVIAIGYMTGALLVFGIDIRLLEVGPVRIEFEDNSQSSFDRYRDQDD